MDCGIPFCNNGCPVNNQIPDWNDLVYRGNFRYASEPAFDQQLPGIHRPHLPGALRIRLYAGHQRRSGRHQVDRTQDHRCEGWENGWIQPQPAAHKTGKKVAVVGSGPAGLAAAQQLARVGHAVTVSKRATASAACCATAFPTSRWKRA
jgi:glutamate synthase (NADPH/NADH) small chain